MIVQRCGLFLLLLPGCFGPDFHAETDRIYEPIAKVATRVPHRPHGGCAVELGTIHIHGTTLDDDHIAEIARKAAAVGGNQYFIRENFGPTRIQTHGGYVYGSGYGAFGSSSVVSRDVHIIADVYRNACGSSDDDSNQDDNDDEIAANAARHRALAAIRRDPKYPDLGTTLHQAQAICSTDRGSGAPVDDVLRCKVDGVAVFACTFEEDRATKCTHWKEGAKVVAERDALIEDYGQPESQSVTTEGFAVFMWKGGTLKLEGVDKGILITATK
jgi:hypothetical protein